MRTVPENTVYLPGSPVFYLVFCPYGTPMGSPRPHPVPVHTVVLLRQKISIVSNSHCLIRLFSQLDVLEEDYG